MSYIWVNQQHNGANWSPKPLNMALFLKIHSNNYVKKFYQGGEPNCPWGGLKSFWMGGTVFEGGTAPLWGIAPPIPPMLSSPSLRGVGG